MKNKLQILQISSDNWEKRMQLPENMDWHFFWPKSTRAIKKVMGMHHLRSFHAIILEDLTYLSDLFPLLSQITPYTIFYNQKDTPCDAQSRKFLKKTCAIATDLSDANELVRKLSKALFRGQYGDKLTPIDMIVHPSFQGSICYNGYENIELFGDYGEEFRPLLSWKYNIRASEYNPIELWLEYVKDTSCDIRLLVRNVQDGSTSDFVKERVFSSQDLEEAVLLDDDFSSFLSLSLEARGNGSLKVGAIHQRLTRYEFGKYVLGGKILHDQQREEINYFFYPGDYKPPLNVYFSGYRRAEGFEGFGMMRQLGAPFLLFSDPRIDGGAFYLGSEELEQGIKEVIREHLDLLGFSEQELILSGLSMGTYGAMYYGADFSPKAIIVGKPLANLGFIAKRGRLELPGIFPTAFDILRHQSKGEASHDAMDALDKRFWDKFTAADFSRTTFGLSYMKEEDYDPKAYSDLVDALYYTKARVVSKGTSGRHNDGGGSAANWVIHFYKMILEQDFGRKFR